MGVMLGGDKAWKTRQTGDIVSSFQWVNGEPSMVLWAARRHTLGAGAFVLQLSAAHKYADNRGMPTRYCAQMTEQIARQLGMEPGPWTQKRIADVILDGLSDLVDMPPEPTGLTQAQTQAIGEMSIKVEGETVHEAVVTAPTEAELAAVH